MVVKEHLDAGPLLGEAGVWWKTSELKNTGKSVLLYSRNDLQEV